MKKRVEKACDDAFAVVPLEFRATDKRFHPFPSTVMAGLVPAIHKFSPDRLAWMAGTSPAMTIWDKSDISVRLSKCRRAA